MPSSVLLSTAAGKAKRFALTLSVLALAGWSGSNVDSPTRSVVVWNGGDGAWTGHWTLPMPQLADPLIYWIDGGNPVSSGIYLDVDAVAAGLTVDQGDSLFFLDGHSLTIGSLLPGFLSNDGLVRVFADEGISSLIISGGMLDLAGSGVLELTHSTNSRIIGGGGQSATLINSSSIRGAGVIGDGSMRLVNYGDIVADRPLELLQILPDSNVTLNVGTMRASDEGVLVLHPGAYDNVSGEIVAGENSYVEIDGTTITGGSLKAIGKGIIRAHHEGAHLHNITLSGRLELGLARLTLGGQITNNGTIEFVPDGMLLPSDYAELFVPEGMNLLTLGGSGEIRLSWTKVFAQSATPPQLIHAQGHTIRGDGLFGYNTLSLKNMGTIVADRENPLVFDPAGSTVAVNEGTLRAEGLGGFIFTAGTFRNNGTIEVMPGSRCFYTATAVEANIADGGLNGGTWRIIADNGIAFIIMAGPGVFFNHADVTLSGQGASFSVINSMLVNTGRFAIENGRNFTTQGLFFTNDGELEVGAASVFTAGGPLTQSDAGLCDIEASAINLQQGNASVRATGSATLSGTLRVHAAPGFEVTPGQELHLIAASSIVGQFDEVIAPPGVEIRYEAAEVIADVVQVCIGDLNDDDEINALDLLELIAQWGDCADAIGRCSADFNVDGQVDAADLLTVLAGWGTCPVSSPTG
jgi:hypothetical protein